MNTDRKTRVDPCQSVANTALPGTVKTLHRDHCCLALALAGIGECAPSLWVFSHFLPVAAQGCYRSPHVRASGFVRNLAGYATLVSGDEVVALSDTNLLTCTDR